MSEREERLESSSKRARAGDGAIGDTFCAARNDAVSPAGNELMRTAMFFECDVLEKPFAHENTSFALAVGDKLIIKLFATPQ